MVRERRLAIVTVTGVLVLVVLALAVLLAKGSSAGSPSPSTGAPSRGAASQATSSFDGAALPLGTIAPDFALTDQSAHRVSLGGLRGQTVVIAFLYTTCGASCAVIAQQIRGALDELPQPVPVLIVSADPATDTPSRVRRFLAQASLSGRARYLTGSIKELDRVWRAYRVTPASAGRLAFAKHASLLLVDPQGQERVLYGPEQLTAESLAHDIRALQTG